LCRRRRSSGSWLRFVFCGESIRPGIGPFPEAGQDEALGARRIWSGADMAEAAGGTQIAEVVAPVGGAVVGHHPLDADAMSGEEGPRPEQEGEGAPFFSSGRI
jgi:hypothetical protein